MTGATSRPAGRRSARHVTSIGARNGPRPRCGDCGGNRGAIPFGAGFGLLWLTLPESSQIAMFAYYTGVFVFMSLSMTVLVVPYLALQPEMALGYDARTSLNAYRNAGSILGVFAAIAVRPVAEAFGGGAVGYASAGALYGALVAAPWLAIYAVIIAKAGDFLRRSAARRAIEAVTGTLLIGLGVRIAAEQR